MAGSQHVLLELVPMSGCAGVEAECLATGTAMEALIAALGTTVPNEAIHVRTARAGDRLL